jgi:hypothetical protein
MSSKAGDDHLMKGQTPKAESGDTRSPVRRRQNRQRVQIDLLPAVYDRVFELMVVNNLDSVRTVFRDAFRLYEWYTRRRLQGWEIQLVHKDGRVAEVDLGLVGEPSSLTQLLEQERGEKVGT